MIRPRAKSRLELFAMVQKIGVPISRRRGLVGERKGRELIELGSDLLDRKDADMDDLLAGPRIHKKARRDLANAGILQQAVKLVMVDLVKVGPGVEFVRGLLHQGHLIAAAGAPVGVKLDDHGSLCASLEGVKIVHGQVGEFGARQIGMRKFLADFAVEIFVVDDGELFVGDQLSLAATKISNTGENDAKQDRTADHIVKGCH